MSHQGRDARILLAGVPEPVMSDLVRGLYLIPAIF
jgi:hypothetical protein